MAPFKEREMTWREFEQRCEGLTSRCFPKKKYRVECNQPRTYADGMTKRMDISVAERRQGGKHFVIDCKHFPIAELNENEIQTTLDYKRRSRAAKAIILVSKSSNCPSRFMASARRQGVLVLTVSTSNSGLVNAIRDFFFAVDLS